MRLHLMAPGRDWEIELGSICKRLLVDILKQQRICLDTGFDLGTHKVEECGISEKCAEYTVL